MSTLSDKPTARFYGLFQYIFDHYNETLFEGKINDCILVITRRKDVMGHYSFKRWFHAEDQDTDELALNPSMFVKFPLIEICQTMVHEMCHGWQYHYGAPSRNGYHNKEWAEKMISLGLIPSDTGLPGGKQTGQQMNDYPIEGGRFMEVTEDLLNNEVFHGLYLEVNPELLELLTDDKPAFEQIKDITLAQEQSQSKPKAQKQKIKYSCGCSNVWGKPDLDLLCNSCGEVFEAK